MTPPRPGSALLYAGLAGALTLAGAHSARAQAQRLPDLVASAATLRDHGISREGGRVLLRLASTVANIGDGPLEVVGRRRGREMPASQVIYTGRGRAARQVPIGAFTYHPEHRHWHVLQVAEYRLRDASGAVVASSDKISFCLADDHFDFPQLPGAPRRAVYGPCPKNPAARQIRSGISVGWGDTYPKYLPGQWIDVTDVPSGTYTLETEVNPDGIIQEKTRANNTASVRVRIP